MDDAWLGPGVVVLLALAVVAALAATWGGAGRAASWLRSGRQTGIEQGYDALQELVTDDAR